MADQVLQHSIGELVTIKNMSSSLSWTAGGASDSVTWTGSSINRNAFATGTPPRTMALAVSYDATLASGSTLAFTIDVQDSADNTNWSDYATEAIATAGTGISGGGRQFGVANAVIANQNAPAGTPGIDLSGARQYIRCLVVPHMGRTGTDTAVMMVVGVFAGFDTLAAPLK